jgi:hypothetical protein
MPLPVRKTRLAVSLFLGDLCSTLLQILELALPRLNTAAAIV